MRFRIGGITVMLRGILGGKQNKKIVNTNKKRSSLFILSKRNDDLIVMQNAWFEFRQVLRLY